MRLQEDFWTHPKVLQVGNRAIGVYVRMLSYCALYDTGGVVIAPAVRAIVGRDRRTIKTLEGAGLLERLGGGAVRVNSRLEEPSLAYRRGAPGRASAAQVLARVEFYGGLCWICRTEPADTIDHVKPLRRGGSNWPANLRPACRPCNSRKGARWPFELGEHS